MSSIKPVTLTDISFVERLTKQNVFQVLLNLALYLSFVLPLANQAQIPMIQSPWKDLSSEIASVFLLSGFGFIYWVSRQYIGVGLRSLRRVLEFYLWKLAYWLGINLNKEESLTAIYYRNKSMVRESDIISYLSKNDNSFIRELYENRKERNVRAILSKENTVTTFTLFLLHWHFNSSIYLGISQYLPTSLSLVALLLLLWSSSAELLSEDSNYFYIPGNPIRESKS